MALATAALTVGGHALEWTLRDLEAGPGRVSSFELAAITHVGTGLGMLLIAVGKQPEGRWYIASMILLWAGLVAFCGPLYYYGLTGSASGMTLTMGGFSCLILAWIVAAFGFLRSA
ncbi:MAG: DUF423 domain-containing protein [Pseudomonadota bacterium]